jgi:glycosyltransferase involved in cell wall biosynthesis
MILFISDLDLKGSGYMNIAIALCKELADRGHDVYVLGIGYKGDEHNFPFRINPVKTGQAFQQIHAMMSNLRNLSEAGQFPKIEGVIVALDIPLQEKVLQFPRGDIPYMGIFPIESGPLCPTWANIVARMDERLVISQFGHKQIADAGLQSTYIPIGIDTEAWRLPKPNERKQLREALGYTEDDFVVLTVADNQERKNLSHAAQMIAGVKDRIPVKWQLVTRIDSKVGWSLGDPPFDLGSLLTTYERGLTFDRLWTLYAVSDAFLLTSKAEGLCMPIIEAMAVGVPVAATNCTAVTEHLVIEQGRFRPKLRGFPLEVEYETIDAWGNSLRHFVSVESGIKRLIEIHKLRQSGRIKETIDAGVAYAKSRLWSDAGDVLESGVRRLLAKSRAKEFAMRDPRDPMVSGIPPTLPQRIPTIGEGDDGEV